MGRVVERSTVPTGLAVFRGDAAIRRFVEREHDVVRWTEFDTGGHFAATEVPDLLLADIREFFRLVRWRSAQRDRCSTTVDDRARCSVGRCGGQPPADPGRGTTARTTQWCLPTWRSFVKPWRSKIDSVALWRNPPEVFLSVASSG